MAEQTSRVVRFPPLPDRPEPPRFPLDPRQDRFRAIAGNLAAAGGDGFHVAVANTVDGYPASAIDIGRLKATLESGLTSFDMDLVRERWDADVRDWLARTLLRWVQRCKSVTMKPEQGGIRVELETQDDLGYYRYVFELFPGKR